MRRLDFAADAVMHDCGVRPRARDGRERNVLELAGVAAEAFQLFDGLDLGQFSGRGLLLEPGEKARHRGAVAAMRLPRALDLGFILHRLHGGDGIGAVGELAAGLGDDAPECVGGTRLVEPDEAARGGEARRGRW